ncbi:S8 family serine peptidase [Clostridium sp. 19966]|uniref:S8 family serine peptidase n=1 Tax=Clostridium sp. 19966 TaxID=2768166 RepID=UPI0028DFD2EE|nr:S8 family serine peptidase [Clostridium sp. 19966]MDT8718914.1 S8 family serine peptidase [Clostridium sp. 19966]
MRKLRKEITALALMLCTLFTIFNGFPVKAVSASTLGEQKLKQIALSKLVESTNENFKETAAKTKDVYRNAGNASEGDGLSKEKTSNSKETIRLIVELDGQPASEKIKPDNNKSQRKAAVNDVKASQKSIIEAAQIITGNKVTKNYGYLVNGFSINGKRDDIDKIRNLSGVKAVTEAKKYYPDMKFAKELTQAYSTWQDLGFKGEGMVVSIIDTGIDYNHKDMKLTNPEKAKIKPEDVKDLGKYFTAKVPYGYNFADCNTDILDTNPGTEMHGMHVAGIVAANGNSKDIDSFNAVQGVAPEAQLLAMKVFTNNSQTNLAFSDDIIAAIEESVIMGADVINMSLGSDAGFTDENDPEQKAIKKAVDNGVAVVVAGGNSSMSSNANPPNPKYTKIRNRLGTIDNGTIGSPATSPDAITVGSYDNSYRPWRALEYTYDGSQSNPLIPYTFLWKDFKDTLKDEKGYEVVDCGDGKSNLDPAKLSGKVALIKYPEDEIYEPYGEVRNVGVKEAEAAKAAGAVGVLFYKPGDETVEAELGYTIPFDMLCGVIPSSSAETLKNLIGKNLKITFKGELKEALNSTANEMSEFSSWGPTPEFGFKPEITAPGGSIYSTVNNNAYTIMSGTSMATPNVSGGEALILEGLKAKNSSLKGRDLVEFIKTSSINTAKVEMDKYKPTVPYSPRRQGSGMLQIKDAINNSVAITDLNGNAAIALKNIDKSTSFELKLKNYGNSEASYNLGDASILTEESDAVTQDVHEKNIDGAKMSFSRNTITVHAGGEVKVKITISLPNSLKKQNYVEGFIQFNSKDSQKPSLHVPYIAFYGDWDSIAAFDKPAWDKDSKLSDFWSKYVSYYDSMERGHEVKDALNEGTTLGYIDSNGRFTSGGTYNYTAYGEQYNINPDDIAFSPNDDGYIDAILPRLYMFRNAKQITTEVLDENKRVIQTTSIDSSIKKDLLYNELHWGFGTVLKAAAWNGKLYDKATGEYKLAPEGKYYMKLSVIPASGGKAQEITMPFKLDLTKPTIQIISENKAADGNYILKWKAEDNLSGINNDNTQIAVNGQAIRGEKINSEGNGIYSTEVNLIDNSKNTLELLCFDGAGNSAYATSIVPIGKVKPLSINNITDGMWYNQNNLTIAGSTSEDVAALTINGAKLKPDEAGTFSYTLQLTQGKNVIDFTAEGKTGNILSKESYTVYCDSIAPVIIVSSVTKNATGINIKGTVKEDNLRSFTINSEEVPVAKDGSFDYDTKLSDEFFLKASDPCNSTSAILYINSSEDSDYGVSFNNLTSLMTISKADTDNDIYTINGIAYRKDEILKINDNVVPIKDDSSFTYKLKLQQGENKVKVELSDSSGNEIYNYSYVVFYNSIMPDIKLIKPYIKDDKVYTTNGKITLKGELTNTSGSYKLFIDGNCILNKSDDAVGSNNFEYTVKVKQGDIITIRVEDSQGNVVEKKLQAVIGKTPKN